MSSDCYLYHGTWNMNLHCSKINRNPLQFQRGRKNPSQFQESMRNPSQFQEVRRNPSTFREARMEGLSRSQNSTRNANRTQGTQYKSKYRNRSRVKKYLKGKDKDLKLVQRDFTNIFFCCYISKIVLSLIIKFSMKQVCVGYTAYINITILQYLFQKYMFKKFILSYTSNISFLLLMILFQSLLVGEKSEWSRNIGGKGIL